MRKLSQDIANCDGFRPCTGNFVKLHFSILLKRRAGDLYPILKLERNARVLNRIKVELLVSLSSCKTNDLRS